MNGCVPDWDTEEDYGSFIDLPSVKQKVFPSNDGCRGDHELLELVWQNGNVITRNKNNYKITSLTNKSKQLPKPEPQPKCGGISTNFSNLYEEEETAAWPQYSLDNSLDRNFCSGFYQGMSVGESKLARDVFSNGQCTKLENIEDAALLEHFTSRQSNKFQILQNTMPPPKMQHGNSIPSKANMASGIVNFSHFSRPIKLNSGYASFRTAERNLETNRNQKKVGESSLLSSKVSRNSQRNSIQGQRELVSTFTEADYASAVEMLDNTHKKATESGHAQIQDQATIASSSSISRACPISVSHKRKERDADESECQSEETEYQSVDAGKSQRTTRRSRAAEVHNLSERRRRDRINEKMKALQELIPHCNKTDKASMLDEAIEYLKSLQQQVQMMWMGNGMAPMMFPSAQHYLSFMGTMPPIPGAVQMPTVPFVNQPMSPTRTSTTTTQSIDTNGYKNQLQNYEIPEAFVGYLGLQNMQSLQGMNNFNQLVSQLMQPNFTLASTSCCHVEKASPLKDDQNG